MGHARHPNGICELQRWGGETKLPPETNPRCILFIPPFQPAQIRAHITRAPRGPWPSLRDPTATPRRGGLSGGQTNLQLLRHSQGQERNGSVLCLMLLKEATCLPSEGRPALPSLPKSSFSPLTARSRSSSPSAAFCGWRPRAGLFASAGNGGSCRAALL